MNRLSNLLLKISNWKTLLFFLFLLLAFNIFIFPNCFKSRLPVAEQNLPVIDLQMTYNPDNVKSIVAMYSGKAKEAYILGVIITDSIYPIVYFCFLAIALSLVFYLFSRCFF